MPFRTMRFLSLAGLSLFFLLAACDGSDTSGPPDAGSASLSVFLTDAPGDVEAVWVEIEGVSLQHETDGSLELLDNPTELILLTDLVESTHLLVADLDMEVSTYSQLRLKVGDAILLSSDGTVYVKGNPTLPADLAGAPTGELVCPSCSQSGLKVTIPNDEMELEEGDAALVLDFDVAESFGHKAGNSGKWIMHPVIHGALAAGGTEATGTIRGTVDLALDAENTPIAIPECPVGETRSVQDFIPTATATELVDGEGLPIVRTGDVAEDGTFVIAFLDPGGYTMGYTAELNLEGPVLSFTATVEPTEVTVDDQDVEGVAYTIQSAQCLPAG